MKLKLLGAKHNIIFIVMMMIGVGLCIGGAFVAPLLIPGTVFISGALGMYSGALSNHVTVVHPRHESNLGSVIPDSPLEEPVEFSVHQSGLINQFVDFHIDEDIRHQIEEEILQEIKKSPKLH